MFVVVMQLQWRQSGPGRLLNARQVPHPSTAALRTAAATACPVRQFSDLVIEGIVALLRFSFHIVSRQLLQPSVWGLYRRRMLLLCLEADDSEPFLVAASQRVMRGIPVSSSDREGKRCPSHYAAQDFTWSFLLRFRSGVLIG